MGSSPTQKPHLVCIPYPAQGHITPMMNLAKLLHSHGFYITFVNSHYNHKRLLRSKALLPSDLDGFPDFRFQSIPDGLPPSDADATQDIPNLCVSSSKHMLSPLLDLLSKLNDPSSTSPPVSCIVCDGVMSFALDAAERLGVPGFSLWTTSACGFMGYLHYPDLSQRGLFPLKDERDITNGYLETPLDWIPGMENARLKDLPSFFRTTDEGDIMFNFCMREAQRAHKASGIILNTFDELERPVLEAMESMLPPVYTVGPLLHMISDRITKGTPMATFGANLWAEERGCLEWLEGRAPGSVLYVNFGSITVMTNEQLLEFAWGLANSMQEFLWVIRVDLVQGDATVLPQEFLDETKGRSMIASWCPQEAVLSHRAVGAFLTHSGWNSTLESICAGVPQLSWPFFAEQLTNCRYACTEWRIAMEINSAVKRGEVEGLIRELMGGEKGKDMKKREEEWKQSAAMAVRSGGSSHVNFDRLVNDIIKVAFKPKLC